MELLKTLLFFALALGILVTAHEFGHYWVARRLGVKILRFCIGFGRPSSYSTCNRRGQELQIEKQH